jgi:hypothetical protein
LKRGELLSKKWWSKTCSTHTAKNAGYSGVACNTTDLITIVSHMFTSFPEAVCTIDQ